MRNNREGKSMKTYAVLCQFLVFIIFFTGCNNKSKHIINKANTDDINNNTAVLENEHSSFNTDNEEKTEFELDEIKQYILKADALVYEIYGAGSIESFRTIGSVSDVEVVGYIGEYDTFEKVMQLIGEYYTEEIAELELRRSYLANLYGQTCFIAASGENRFYIEEKSQIELLINEDDRKVVEMEAFNDFDDSIKVEYTLEKQDDGKWKITGEKGYFDELDQTKRRFNLDVYSAEASSYLDNYFPINALDEDRNTAWVEGVTGDGINEWILLKSDSELEVNGIEIVNGYTKSDDLYMSNNRIKKVKLEFSDNTEIEKELEDDMSNYQTIAFEKTVITDYIKITIIEVYKGEKYNDTCISEIRTYR